MNSSSLASPLPTFVPHTFAILTLSRAAGTAVLGEALRRRHGNCGSPGPALGECGSWRPGPGWALRVHGDRIEGIFSPGCSGRGWGREGVGFDCGVPSLCG